MPTPLPSGTFKLFQLRNEGASTTCFFALKVEFPNKLVFTSVCAPPTIQDTLTVPWAAGGDYTIVVDYVAGGLASVDVSGAASAQDDLSAGGSISKSGNGLGVEFGDKDLTTMRPLIGAEFGSASIDLYAGPEVCPP